MEIALFLEYKQPVNPKIQSDLISVIDPYLRQSGLSPVNAGSYRIYISSNPTLKTTINEVLKTIKKQPNFRTVIKTCFLTTSFRSI